MFVYLFLCNLEIRRGVEESLQQFRNEKNRYLNRSSSPSKLISNDSFDPNQNKYHHFDGNILTSPLSSSVTNINHTPSNCQPQTSSYNHHHHHHHHLYHQLQQQQQQQHGNERFSMGNANLNGMSNKIHCTGNSTGLSSAVLHPALLNIINEAQGMKYRGTYLTITISSEQ